MLCALFVSSNYAINKTGTTGEQFRQNVKNASISQIHSSFQQDMFSGNWPFFSQIDFHVQYYTPVLASTKVSPDDLVVPV